MKIKEIPESCCLKSEIKAIEFDSTKKTVCKKNGWTDIKSCDALKFVIEDERIDLIEMKSLSAAIIWLKTNMQKERQSETESHKEKLSETIEDFKFKEKIRDSLTILQSIILKQGLLKGEERDEFYNIKKQPIFLTDIDYKNEPLLFSAFVGLYIGNLSSDLKIMLENEISRLEASSLNNIQKPLLMDCVTFEKQYK